MKIQYLQTIEDQKRQRPLPCDLPGEVWQSIAEYPGFDVSNLGRVRKLHLQVEDIGLYKIRARTPVANGELSFSTAYTTKRVAYAVLENFVGPCPEGHEVYYRDGNLENCAVSNLHYGPKRFRRSNVTINLEIARRIRERLKEESSVAKVQREFGVSRNIVSNIKFNKGWVAA